MAPLSSAHWAKLCQIKQNKSLRKHFLSANKECQRKLVFSPLDRPLIPASRCGVTGAPAVTKGGSKWGAGPSPHLSQAPCFPAQDTSGCKDAVVGGNRLTDAPRQEDRSSQMNLDLRPWQQPGESGTRIVTRRSAGTQVTFPQENDHFHGSWDKTNKVTAAVTGLRLLCRELELHPPV